MPSRMRQYAAFEYVQDVLGSLLKANVLVTELKSEALRDRHWSTLYKALRMPSSYHSSGYIQCSGRLIADSLTQFDTRSGVRLGPQEKRDRYQGSRRSSSGRGTLCNRCRSRLTIVIDGTRGVSEAGSGNLDIVCCRLGQLSEQMQADQVWLAVCTRRYTDLWLHRCWDDLFAKCSEHLNSLSAMRLSPYYRGKHHFVCCHGLA